MANKNKNKGKSWERDVCKVMSQYFGGSWIRVPNSGAFIGGANACRMQQLSAGQIHNAKGDIIPPDEYDIVLECKSYKDFAWNTLLGDGNAIMDKWLGQVEIDVVDPDEFYAVIFKINNKGSYIVVNTKFMANGLKALKNFSMYNYNGEVYLITDFESFIASNVDAINSMCKKN